MTDVLNGHLSKMFPNLKSCSEWTSEELQGLQADLYAVRDPNLDDIYSGSSDRRSMLRSSLEEHQAHWAEMNRLAAANPHMQEMLRDGHCHEVVMWLVHHISAPEQQTDFSKRWIPTLATRKHECSGFLTDDEKALCAHYEDTYSCSNCHSGSGITAQDYSDMDGVIPEDPKFAGYAR